MMCRIDGMAARIRVSSATWPPLSGTLKSTRISTRLPLTSISSMVSFFIDSLLRLD